MTESLALFREGDLMTALLPVAQWNGVERIGETNRGFGDALPPAVWSISGRPSPGERLQQFALSSPKTTIGRNPENTLQFRNPTVSGRHAELECSGQEILVRDLGSTNGTFLNGRRIVDQEAVLDGAALQFGTAMFTVHHRCETDRNQTVAANVAASALAHLNFDLLISEPAVVPHFQPIISFATMQPIGYEVLVRSLLVGLEDPFKMFGMATERNLEVQLSQVVRREGVAMYRRTGLGGALYLNTHPSEVNSPELVESLVGLRDEFPDAPIVVEIHEAATTSAPALRHLRRNLAILKMQLAYDDFGAGQSRLLELIDTPPDVLKFDMCLVQGLGEASQERRHMVASLVKIVRDLGVTTLAEGVETASDAQACQEVGFEYAQGYFFGRPASAASWSNLAPIAAPH
jgi:EAL domain-containing protein (putative c-di-GMP-specific phosphodiesterase class I)